MKILIPTQHQDIHAKVVARALASKGHDAVLWYGGDLPTQQTISLNFARGEGVELELRGADLDHHDAFDAVWLRRPSSPTLPDDMHPSDNLFAIREWRHFLEGVWDTLDGSGFWVNPRQAARRAECKPVQLSEALRVGLEIPPSLMSNDPRRIRAFIYSNDTTHTIYKPFTSTQWELEKGGSAYLFTATVEDNQLPEDELLRLSPGIFQPRIAKDHELRVTIIGDRIFVAKLESQAIDNARVDWRIGTRSVAIQPGHLPSTIEARCRALMTRLGLVFACLDFIVTPEGEHIFLEVNQMGQFLWLEELCPQMPLLDAFCELLIQRCPDFDWSPDKRGESLRLRDFYDEIEHAEIDERHVHQRPTHLLSDATVA